MLILAHEILTNAIPFQSILGSDLQLALEKVTAVVNAVLTRQRVLGFEGMHIHLIHTLTADNQTVPTLTVLDRLPNSNLSLKSIVITGVST